MSGLPLKALKVSMSLQWSVFLRDSLGQCTHRILLDFQDRDNLWISEPGCSTCLILQVQFRAGLTEALTFKSSEKIQTTSPPAPLFSAKWLWRPKTYTLSGKKGGGKKQSIKCKQSQVSNAGRGEPLKQLSVCHSSNKESHWEVALGEAFRNGTPRIISELGVWGVWCVS